MAQTITSLDRIKYGAGGAIYRILADAAGTRNTYFAFEATEPPGGGPPLHVHTREDEFFLVLQGEITFSIDGRVTRVGAGGSAFVPRGIPHCFKNTSDRAARLLILFTPAGIEGFFEYGAANDDGTAPSEEEMIERLVRLAPDYGIEVVGPSPL